MHSDSLFDVTLNRSGHITRRNLLRLGGAAAAGMGLLGRLSAHAADIKHEGRACILVWLAGAPSQFELWDPKPGTETGGQTRSVKTDVAGLEIAEYWPKMAQTMKHVAVLRTISGKEAAHERGDYHLHTGRRLTGGVKFPHFGSVVADQIGDANSDLPNFVSIGQTLSSGFLGVRVAPFVIGKPGQLPDDVSTDVADARARRRLELLRAQESEFAAAGAKGLVDEHASLYERASKLMKSPRLKAFELTSEPEPIKAAYGKSQFGQGLLVARRLVEAGVPFVEVRRGGWDMHDSIYQKIGPAAADVDVGLSQLLTDLKQRSLLEKTLVVCMGEFGRTPKINDRTPAPGRDHWARNFSLLLAGAGIKGGQVIGKTSDDGTEIVDRPIAVEDLFQTMCRSLGIDAGYEFVTPEGRPLKIVDGGTAVNELFA